VYPVWDPFLRLSDSIFRMVRLRLGYLVRMVRKLQIDPAGMNVDLVGRKLFDAKTNGWKNEVRERRV